NFCIIAHIDHGKSTLADRMLEITGTIPQREMKDQVLDSMELERERGITIKMQPVRMIWSPKEAPLEPKSPRSLLGGEYILNLIDTPGHIDFSYEVSRALKAVEGAVLLVDATQGIQAQTLSVLNLAKSANLSIIPVVTKIDSPRARIIEIKDEIAKLLNCNKESILEVSGKTGEGVEDLLNVIVEKVPAPLSFARRGDRGEVESLRALVFDFKYSTHKGVIVFVRLMSGEIKAGDLLEFKVANHKFTALEVGIFNPKEKSVEKLRAGEIGYIVTGVKEPGVARVGDTIGKKNEAVSALLGYDEPMPVVWASIYPEDQNDLVLLRQSLSRLRLTDSSLVFEEEASSILGKGFRCGFLGLLHLEIISERLKREFDLNLIITLPSITYDVILKNKSKQRIYSPAFFPEDGLIEAIFEPRVKIKIIIPEAFMNETMKILYEHEASIESSDNFGDERFSVEALMPLRELMRNFFDQLKSVS
ncbi:MAG: translation elongation factor 4, partial [Patescibacteria group bacterium]